MSKKRILLTDVQRRETVECYLRGERIKSIARKFNVNHKTIGKNLRRAGIPIMPREDRSRVYTHDEKAFSISTPESLYWIGFLFADGSLRKPKGGNWRLSLGLCKRDKNHLLSFRKFLGATNPLSWEPPRDCCIKDRKFRSTGNYRLDMSCSAVGDHLASIGLNSKKVDRWPTEELQNSVDFWRGMIDGDGCIEGTRIQLGSAKKEVILDFRRFVLGILGEGSVGKVYPQAGSWRLSVNSHSAILLARRLYYPGCVALRRKLKRAREISAKSTVAKGTFLKISREKEEVIWQLRQRGRTLNSIADEFGVSRVAVAQHIRRYASGSDLPVRRFIYA